MNMNLKMMMHKNFYKLNMIKKNINKILNYITPFFSFFIFLFSIIWSVIYFHNSRYFFNYVENQITSFNWKNWLNINKIVLFFCFVVMFFLFLNTILFSIKLFFNFKKKPKNLYSFSFLFFSLFLLLVTIFFSLTSNLPIALSNDKQSIYLIKTKIRLFKFINFSENDFNSLLKKNFLKNNFKKNYIYIFSFLTFIFTFYFLALFYIKLNPILLHWFFKIAKKFNYKKKAKFKEIFNESNDKKIDYFEKQALFFKNNKNKNKKISNELIYTQKIDLNKKEDKKLVLIETDDNDEIIPNSKKKNLEKLKKKSMLDDLFLKDVF